MRDFQQTIIDFNDLGHGYHITLQVSRKLGLTAANLSDIALYIQRYRSRERQAAANPGSTPPWLPSCLRTVLSRGEEKVDA